MITLRTTRQEVETAISHFYPYINLYKESRVNNLTTTSLANEEYLSTLVINCLLTEIEWLFKRKLINTKGPKMKFEFSDAQGVVLYKTLIALPLPGEQMYLQLVRSRWLQALDQEIIANNLVHQPKPKPEYEYEEDEWE